MRLAQLSSIRLSTRTDALGKVRIAYEINHNGSSLEAVFECISCADLMHWVEFCKSWECSHCGYLLDSDHAERVISHASSLLKTLTNDVSRKANKQWAWVTWLLRLLRPKEASKSLFG